MLCLLDKFVEYFMYFQNVGGDFGCGREVACNFKYIAQNESLGNNAIHWCYYPG